MSSNGGTTNANKDVIYIDVDDEITGIIDKMHASPHKIVALVLPKRSGVFQSIVNMKLLKRSADTAKKHIVLITGEAGLLPLAGTVGLHVAKTLQSRPEIPDAPALAGANDVEDVEEALAVGDDALARKLDASRSVGDLASSAAEAEADDDDTIEIDEADIPKASATEGAAKKSKKPKKDKSLKVPNFSKFRMVLILGGAGLVGLIVILVVCASVLPKATITVKTDSVAVSSSINVKLNTAAVTASVGTGVVPAGTQQTQKTQTQQVDATGQRNDGAKATGSIKVTNCGPDTLTLPAGTGFSASGKTFVSNSSVSVPKSGYSFTPGGFVCNNDGAASVPVTAQNGGADSNLSAQSYTVAGSPTNVKATGSDMTGGTDQITKIVSQSDVDGAKQKIVAQDTTAVKQELQSALQSKGYYAIIATLNAGTPDISTSANVGDPASSVTVTEKITYTMMGARQDDLQKLIASSVNKQIDPSKQKILDYGLDGASFNVQSQTATNALAVMQTTSVAGSALNIDTLKQQVAGKKSGDAEQIIKSNPSVTSVDVHLSPFWVSAIPKKTSKITIQIEKPQASASNAKR